MSDSLEAPEGFENADRDYKLWNSLYDRVKQLANERKFNVIIFGKLGAGKTTFQNTLLSTFTERFGPNKDIVQVDRTHGGGEHTTNKVTHRALDFGDKTRAGEFKNITIVDTWGWKEGTEANYKRGEFKLILGGNIKKEWKLDYDPEEYKTDKKIWNATPRESDKIHAAICVLAADTVSNDDKTSTSPFYLQLRKFLKDAKEFGIHPVVLLSKVDIVDRTLSGEGYKAVYSSSDLYEVYRRLYQVGFSKTQIFPCKLYHDVRIRQAHVEVTVMRCLLAALENKANLNIPASPAPIRPQTARPQKIVRWTGSHVASWLHENHFDRYEENFKDIDGSVLINIDKDEELQELGVVSRLDRKRILHAITRLKQENGQ